MRTVWGFTAIVRPIHKRCCCPPERSARIEKNLDINLTSPHFSLHLPYTVVSRTSFLTRIEELIADLAVNIAEDLVLITTAEDIRHT